MPYKYRDEKIPERPGSGGNENRSFRSAIRGNSALNDGITSEDAAAQGSRWDFVTVDELLFGYRRTKNDPDKSGLDAMLSKLIDMISDYQVNDEGRTAAFSEQAKFMESYEAKLSGDHKKDRESRYVSRYHLYVGYQEMDLQELEDYFEWRTLLRRGEEPPFGTGFAVLYAAELIALNEGTKNQEPENKGLESKGPESKGPENKGPESKGPENKGPENKGPENKGPENKGPESKDPESKGTQKRYIFEELLSLQAMVRKQAEEQRKQGYYSDRSEARKLDSIIKDYVLSWGPEPELVQAYCINDMVREAEAVTLSNVEQTDDLSICQVLRNYTEWRTLNSKFFKTAGEDAWRIVARVFRRICKEQKRAGKESLAERMLGRQTKQPHLLYALLPCEADISEGYSIEVSPVTSYHVENGIMQECSYPVMQDQAALREMNELIRECERVLRKKFHYKNQLPNRLKDKKTEQLILQEADQWLKEKERRNRPEIHVDLSKLDAIRDQADLTRDRLLEGIPEGDGRPLEDALNASVHEPVSIVGGASAEDSDVITGGTFNERLALIPEHDSDRIFTENECAASSNNDVFGDAGSRIAETENIGLDGVSHLRGMEQSSTDESESIFDTKQSSADESESIFDAKQSSTGESESIFDAKQSEFLRLLLAGENGADYLQRLAVMPSVFVDAVNEKAFDEIGDSIVEEEGKSWRLVEDYIDDVREMLGMV